MSLFKLYIGYNLDLVFLGCNSLFAKDAGFTDPNDLIGADDFRLTWKEQAELYRKDDLDVVKSGQPKLYYEELRTTSEGKHFTLLTSKVPIRNTKNEIIGILGMYEDITLRKREESELLRMQIPMQRLSFQVATVVIRLWPTMKNTVSVGFSKSLIVWQSSVKY
jgi:PAS domain S-box-containing protein